MKTPRRANRFIRELLPIFERHDKLFIFRTWTVGIYPIGDLMWNKVTFVKTFRHIDSKNFYVSMKYGETDFFDELELSPMWQDRRLQKILKVQTRREREGFGEWPYYGGYQYERYARQLENNPGVRGISVWCQTGGWSRRKNLTFLKNSKIWNELNTDAKLQIFIAGKTADEAASDFFKILKWWNLSDKARHCFVQIYMSKSFPIVASIFVVCVCRR